MISKIFTATPSGFHAQVVEIETDVSNGLPTTIIVGLPDAIVQESRERVRAAIRNSGFDYPMSRISINLAPSDLPKVGSHFDLALSVSILLESAAIRFDPTDKMFIGELALDGSLRTTSGVLSMVLSAKKYGLNEVFVPEANGLEASLVDGLNVYAVPNLKAVSDHLTGKKVLPLVVNNLAATQNKNDMTTAVDFAEIAGQHPAKRALTIAAAGGHNIRLIGPPGSGKTMLAKALAGILPTLTREEILETTNIYSLAGKFSNKFELEFGVVSERPFRAPHHTASGVALIGGGGKPRPGEISLAHNGILFLDELPEFPRQALEVLRQPLEDNQITISRVQKNITFPAKFILVTAQNPCHCGNFGDQLLECVCHPAEIVRYNKKISGPLLDRIDLHVTVPRLKYEEFKNNKINLPTSREIKQLVVNARQIQSKRFSGKSTKRTNKKTTIRTNSEMASQEISQYCKLSDDSEKLLAKAVDSYHLSGRAISRLLKVSRTIADLEGSEDIQTAHLAESLQYRINNSN